MKIFEFYYNSQWNVCKMIVSLSQRIVHSFLTFVTKSQLTSWNASVRQSGKRASQKIGIGWNTRCCTEVSYVRLLLTAGMRGCDRRRNVTFRFPLVRSRNTFYLCITLGASSCAVKTYNSCLLCLVHARDFRLSNREFWVTVARESEGPGDLVNPGSVSPLRNRADSTVRKRLSVTRLTGSRK